MERRRLRAETRQLFEPCEPVTVHRIGWSDRGPDRSMLFSHGTIPYLKQTVNLNGSRVFRSDRTVRSGFNNLVPKIITLKVTSLNFNIIYLNFNIIVIFYIFKIHSS